MRRFATLLSTLALASSGLAFSPAQAADDINCLNGGTFSIVTNVVTSSTGCTGGVVIPDGVIAIGESAFQNAALSSIEIPSSVTSLGKYSFAGTTQLNSVTFVSGSSLATIGESAFQGAALPNITLPTPTRLGHTFKGWYSDAAYTTRIGDGGLIYPVATVSNLYGKLHRNVYALGTQWATSATATDSYVGYEPIFATGAPDATACDEPHMWASANGIGVSTITLTYAKAAVPKQINVYQNNTKGAISSIRISANGTNWTTVYTGDPTKAEAGSCLQPNNYDDILNVQVSSKIKVQTKYVRITVDQSKLQTWAEIDAVQLIGKLKQSVQVVAPSLNVSRKVTLPPKTNQLLKVTWVSSTKKVCKILRGKIKGLKKGTCKVTGVNSGNANYEAFSIKRTIIIK